MILDFGVLSWGGSGGFPKIGFGSLGPKKKPLQFTGLHGTPTKAGTRIEDIKARKPAKDAENPRTKSQTT